MAAFPSLRRPLAVLATLCAVPLFVGSLVACGAPSCKSQCDRSAALDCDNDGVPDNQGVDCASACALYDNINSASGCGGKFGDFSSCLSGISDLCGGTSACDAKLQEWNSCVQAFCVANPTNSVCAQPG